MIVHTITHLIGLCGDSHPSILTFLLGHNEVHFTIDYVKTWFNTKYFNNN